MASFLQALTSPKVLGQVGRYVGFTFLVGGGLMTGCNHLEKRRYESLSNDASSVHGISADTAANEELVEPLLNLKALANGAAPRRAYQALIQAVNGLTAGSNFLWEASYDPDFRVPADCQAVMCRHHKAVVTKLEALIKAARVPTGTYDPEWVKAHDNPMDFWRVTGGIALPLNVRWRGFCETLLMASSAMVDNTRTLWHDNLMGKLDNPKGLLSSEDLFAQACRRMGVQPSLPDWDA